MTSTHASRARKLNSIMRRVSSLVDELAALESELPRPSAQELEEMERRGKYTFDAFFLGYIGWLDFHLDEAANAIWPWLRKFRPSRYPRHFQYMDETFLTRVQRRVKQ